MVVFPLQSHTISFWFRYINVLQCNMHAYTYFDLKHIIRCNLDLLTKWEKKTKKIKFQTVITNGKWSLYVKWSKMRRKSTNTWWTQQQRVKSSQGAVGTQTRSPSRKSMHQILTAARKRFSIEMKEPLKAVSCLSNFVVFQWFGKFT